MKKPSKGTPDWHEHRIAVDTVKNPAKGFMGGPSAEEAAEKLKTKFGYTDHEIKKLKEDINMSTFSQFAQNKDAINFKNAFDEVIQAKVDAALADTKQEVAARLFDAPQVEEGADMFSTAFGKQYSNQSEWKKHVHDAHGKNITYKDEDIFTTAHANKKHVGTYNHQTRTGKVHFGEETIDDDHIDVIG